MNRRVTSLLQELKSGLSLRSDSSRPAWPLLVLAQVLLVSVLGGIAWYVLRSVQAEPDPFTDRLSAIESNPAEASVDQALELARSPRALGEDEHRMLASFLALSAQSAGLSWVGVDFEEGVATDSVQSVTATVTLDGEPFRLPVYIDMLKGFKSIGMIERLEAQAMGADSGLFRMQITYIRPVSVDTEWVEGAAGPHSEAVPALVKAAELQAWRAYAAEESWREARARAMSDSLALKMPAALWGLSRHGEGFVWTPGHGLEPLRSGR
jgi:hypothetical protein